MNPVNAMAEVEPSRKPNFSGKFHSHVNTIKAAWEHVTQALWRRYPNPYSKHVLSEDLLSRGVEGNVLVSKRLVKKINRAPRWIERILGGPSTGCFVEESVVDSTAKTFTTYTRNVSYTTLMLVEEKCVYYVSPENEGWTCCKKQAWIKSNIMGLSRPAEMFVLERYKKNSKKAELGLQYVIEKLSHLCNFVSTPRQSKQPSTV